MIKDAHCYTSLEDANLLEILSLKWTINGSSTFFWKVVMSSGKISIIAVFYRFSASSNNLSTLFTAGKTVIQCTNGGID